MDISFCELLTNEGLHHLRELASLETLECYGGDDMCLTKEGFVSAGLDRFIENFDTMEFVDQW